MKHWPALLLLAAAACGPSARTPTPAPPPATLAGSWESDLPQQPGMVRFEANKCYLFEKGRLEVFAADYRAGRLVLSAWGKSYTWEVSQEGNGLSLRSPDGKLRFRRLPETPAQLEVLPKKLPPSGPLPAERVEAIVVELARRKVLDQAVRLDPALRVRQAEVDADNTAYLFKVMDDVGWIDATRFGRDASVAAFLIAQHAGDLSVLLAVLPLVEEDAHAGRIAGSYYASMYDRVQIMQAEPQRFGTQLGQDDRGEMVVLPLRDRAKVDQFRQELGLPPLADYLESLRRKHGWAIRFTE